jgi:predicted MFS family arabinose efflux permease
VNSPGTAADADARVARASRALLAGNLAIGCGVMVVPGALNDLVASLQVPVAVGGQLVSVGALAVALGAPLLAGLLGRFDRRRLLTFSLLWFAAGHLLAALMPSFATLLPVRALCILGAAVFTPQAAATINVLAPPGQQGRAITFIFLGWSLASVLGMPLGSFIADTLGWRTAFCAVALLSLAAAAWVWRTVPDGVVPPVLTLRAWRSVFTHPALMGLVAVTVLSASGQFTLFSYLAPYYRQVLGASPAAVSLLFLAFGAFGLLGNVLVSRWVDRLGAAHCVTATLALMAVSMALWPLATTLLAVVLVFTPWALGCFSSNSAQQARLVHSAPALAPALLALNSSAMYLGQAIGAASGGVAIAGSGFASLPHTALIWMLLAAALSAALGWRMSRKGDHA